jgi:hypothetical protein
MLIDGRWVPADDGATFDVRNPATGMLLARVPRAGMKETRRAIIAADRALLEWRSRLPQDRAAVDFIGGEVSDFCTDHEPFAAATRSEQEASAPR